jgi:hypothetical protein
MGKEEMIISLVYLAFGFIVGSISGYILALKWLKFKQWIDSLPKEEESK